MKMLSKVVVAPSFERVALTPGNGEGAGAGAGAGAGKRDTVSTQLVAFGALVIVQMGHTLFFRLSQTGGKYDYNTCSAIATSELFKMCLSLYLYLREGGTALEAFGLCVNFRVAPIWVFLAFLYAANNQLTFWMLLYLGPGQLSLGKSTAPMLAAIFLWGFYDERINTGQWLSVMMTVAGLVTVLDPSRLQSGSHGSKFGLTLLTLACIKTGFTSVVNAKLLQKGDHSINALNVILYGYGFLFSILFFHAGLTPGVPNKGYFDGYNQPMVIAVIVCQSVIGVVVSYVLKYGGAIVKTLAAAVQAAVLAVLDSVAFGVPWTMASIAGTMVVLCSTYMYFFVALPLKKYEEPPPSMFNLPMRLCILFGFFGIVCYFTVQ